MDIVEKIKEWHHTHVNDLSLSLGDMVTSNIELEHVLFALNRLIDSQSSNKYNWISVDERLPEDGDKVLILIPVVTDSNIENGVYIGNGNFYGAWCSSRGPDHCYKVSHWMPRPDSPKE